MPKTVQIGNKVYIVPNPGENPGWGEDLTEWICGVTDALETVQGPNDILITSATLANDTSTPTNIPGLTFDVAQVEAVEIKYEVRRIYDSGSTTEVEYGTIQGVYDGSTFFISSDVTGDTGTTITVLNTGQFTYETTDLPNHVSTTIRFKASTIDTP